MARKRYRHLYTLEKLNKVELIEDPVLKTDIFFKMNDLNHLQFFDMIDPIHELSSMMVSELYFVALRFISCRGKARFFVGQLAICEKSSILEFIKFCMDENDVRPLLLAPVFKNTPPWAVFISDEVTWSKRNAG